MKKIIALILTAAVLSSMVFTFTVSAQASPVSAVVAAQDWTADNTTYDPETKILSNGTYQFLVTPNEDNTFTINAHKSNVAPPEWETICIPESFTYDGVKYTCTAVGRRLMSGGTSGNDRVNSTLKKVILPDTITSLANDAFKSCSALSEINLPEGLVTIGNYALRSTAVTSITIPSTVTVINGNAFTGCTALASVNFAPESSLTTIGQNAFDGCTALTSIQLPDSLTKIDGYAFQNSGLTSMNIPASVTSMDARAFNGTDITEFTISGDNTAYTAEEGIIYNKAKTQLVIYPPACTGSFTFPEGVTSTADYAFFGSSVETVTIPANLSLGKNAFMNSALTQVSFADGFNKTSLPERAFAGTAITSITIPASVTVLGANFFSDCTNLSSVIFEACEAETGNYSAVIPKTITAIGSGLFYNCSSIESVAFEDGSTITKVPENFIRNSGVKYLQLPEGTESFGSNAFYDTKSIETIVFGPYSAEKLSVSGITFPATVTSLSKNLLYNSAIPSVDFEEGCTVTSLPEGFVRNSSVVSVTLAPSITSIGNYAFAGLKKLTTLNGSSEVYDLSSVTSSFGTGAFYQTEALTGTMIINAQSIGKECFKQMLNITKFVFKENVQSVSNNIFSLNTGIDEIIFLGKTAPTFSTNIYDRVSSDGNTYTVYYPSDATGYTESANFYSEAAGRTYAAITGPFLAAAANYGDKACVTYTYAGIGISDVKMYAAVYDADGMLIDVKTANAAETSIELDSTQNGAYVKLFTWDSTLNAKPLFGTCEYSVMPAEEE